MIEPGESPPSSTGADADPDPAVADLAEEITRRLQSGESVDLEAYEDRHPEAAGPIRALLPTLHDLVDLGRRVSRGLGGVPRPERPHPPARKNPRP